MERLKEMLALPERATEMPLGQLAWQRDKKPWCVSWSYKSERFKSLSYHAGPCGPCSEALFDCGGFGSYQPGYLTRWHIMSAVEQLRRTGDHLDATRYSIMDLASLTEGEPDAET